MNLSKIFQQIFYSTVRIETTENRQEIENGQPITKTYIGSGTGFIYQYQKNGKDYEFLVTNKHVIENIDSFQLTFTKLGDKGLPEIGDAQKMTFNKSLSDVLWNGHPNPNIDVTVAPIGGILEAIKITIPIYRKGIPASLMPTNTQLKDFDAVEDIVFVGYPHGYYDSKNLLPLARKGITSTPINVDFEGNPIFLVDASVFSGSSGSPVFIHQKGIGLQNEPDGIYFKTTDIIFFVGIIARTLLRDPFKIKAQQTNNTILEKDQIPLNLGVVYKAKTIDETIEHWIKNKSINLK